MKLLLSCFDGSDTEKAALAIDNFTKELRDVRTGVQKEYNWFKDQEKDPSSSSPSSISHASSSASSSALSSSSSDSQRKRLIYLFINDLTVGVSGGVTGNILQNKYHRDTLKDQPIQLWMKAFTWLSLFLVNAALLFYIYLFAIQQTQQRQRAWFKSFLIWLVFEMIVSSSAVVLFTHLLIPLIAYSDVRRIKSKVLSDLLSYRTKSSKLLKDSQRNVKSLLPASLSSAHSDSDSDSFNAAKYLYTSWRLASLFPELPESPFIIAFTTPWPKECFKRRKQEVSTVYDKRYAFIYQAISRVLIFFLSSLIQVPPFLQDLILQLISTSGFGYLFLLIIRLYQINHFLPILPIGVVGLLLYFYFSHESHSLRNRNLSKLSPTPDEEGEGEREREEVDKGKNGNEKEREEEQGQEGTRRGKESDDIKQSNGNGHLHDASLPSSLLSTEGHPILFGDEEEEEGDAYDEEGNGAIRNASRVEINRKGRKLSLQLFQNLNQEIASRESQQLSLVPTPVPTPVPTAVPTTAPTPAPAPAVSSPQPPSVRIVVEFEFSSSDESQDSDDFQSSSSDEEREEREEAGDRMNSIDWEADEMNSEIAWESDEENEEEFFT
jgi:hypothetical protein